MKYSFLRKERSDWYILLGILFLITFVFVLYWYWYPRKHEEIGSCVKRINGYFIVNERWYGGDWEKTLDRPNSAQTECFELYEKE